MFTHWRTRWNIWQQILYDPYTINITDSPKTSKLQSAGNVRINVTFTRLRAIIVAMEKQ
jgi:hypothetical protein